MKGRTPFQPFASEQGIIAFAHRGWAGRHPENTLVSFQAAVDLGIDALEMDIHATRDGVLVVHHDDDVDRTTDGSGSIKSFTWRELKILDAGYHWTADGGETYPFRGNGIRIPTLAQVFEAFPDIWINIDVKQTEPSIIDLFARLIRRHDASHQLCVGSFFNENVHSFRRRCPHVVTALSRSETNLFYLLSKLRLARFFQPKGRALQIPEIHRGLTLVTPRQVRDAHRSGIAVHVWTVDHPSDMKRLADAGVDGLMSNHPDRLLHYLGREPGQDGERE